MRNTALGGLCLPLVMKATDMKDTTMISLQSWLLKAQSTKGAEACIPPPPAPRRSAVIQMSPGIDGRTEERRSTLTGQVRKASQMYMSLEGHMAICDMKNREGKAFLAEGTAWKCESTQCA